MAVNYDTLKFSDWNGAANDESEADSEVFEQIETIETKSNVTKQDKTISEKDNAEINDLFKDFE